MALQYFSLAAGAFNDVIDGNGNNYIPGVVIEVQNLNGSLANIFYDEAGTQPITQDGVNNVTGDNGAFSFFIGQGNYRAVSGGNSFPFSAGFEDDHSKLLNLSSPNAHPATAIQTTDGRNVNQRLDDLPSEVSAVVTAEADRAEVAADVAMAQGWVYADVVTGESERAGGEYFWVVSSQDKEVLELWVKGSTSANDTGKRTPSTKLVDDIRLRVEDINKLRAKYSGTDDILPVITDVEYRVLLGVNKETGDIVASGVPDEQKIKDISDDVLASRRQALYNDNGDVYPVFTDENYRVLLGVDKNTGKVVGSGFGASQNIPINREQESLGYSIAVSDTNHLFVYGQSNSVGGDGAPTISNTQYNNNLSFENGPNGRDGGGNIDLVGVDPLVESEVETPCSGAANYASVLLSSDGVQTSDHVIFCSTAGVGARSIAELSKGHVDGIYSGAIDYVQQAYNQTTNLVVPMMAWIQGERDANTAATPYQDYYDDLIQLQSDFEADTQAITGQAEGVPIVQMQTNYNSLVRDDVARAQFDVTKDSDNFFIAGVSYRVPYVNNVHYGNVGAKLAGCYLGRAYKQLLDGFKPDVLKPLSAYGSDTTLFVKFDVPCKPMVIDTLTIDPVTDFGFTVEDSSGAVPIEAVTIEGDTVRIELSQALASSPVVRYALDVGRGRGVTGEGGGNLRDSAPEVVEIENQEFNLYNFAPAFELSVITSGV